MTALLPVAFPFTAALITGALYKYMPRAAKFLGFAGTSLGLVSVFLLYNYPALFPKAADISSLTIAVFIAFFAFLASLSALKEEDNPWFYFNLLLSAAFALGAVLTDNFLTMLFFWEGLLVTLYLFLFPYNKETAQKAFIINAVGDVVLLAGVCLLYAATHTLSFNDIMLTNIAGKSFWAFILIITGTAAKAGAFPFHSWIAPAAKDAPFSFMAMLPAAIEKLLAVFLMCKIFTLFFPILPAGARVYISILGVITIITAAARMLIFKDLKELLAWNIVMQIGLLILSMGVYEVFTEGDSFFIMNHGIFKASLLAAAFFAAGYLNAAYGGVALSDIKGTAKTSPCAFTVLTVSAAGLAGVTLADLLFVPNSLLADSFSAMPLLAAVPALAMLATLFTFTKVLAAMLQKAKKNAAPAKLLQTVMLLAFIPVVFFTLGLELSNTNLLDAHFAGFHIGRLSVICLVLLLTGVLLGIKVKQPSYEFKKDTYDYAKSFVYYISGWLFTLDRAMDKVFDYLPSLIVEKSAKGISKVHRGNTPQYIIWAVLGIIAFIFLAFKGGFK